VGRWVNRATTLQKVWKIIQMTTTYTGDPWHADESEDCVRIFREHAQIIKAPKHSTPFEEYWPEPKMIKWMLKALNNQ